MHVRETLNIVEVVVSIASPLARVRVEAVQVHVVAHLHAHERGEESTHRLAIVLAALLLLQKVLQLHPNAMAVVAEDWIEQHRMRVREALEQRLAEVIAREVTCRLEHDQMRLVTLAIAPVPHALKQLANVMAIDDVERCFLSHVSLVATHGCHVDAEHRIMGIDLRAIFRQQHDSGVADDGTAAEAPLRLLERQQLEQAPREVVNERVVRLSVLQPVAQHDVLEGGVVHDELALVRHQPRATVDEAQVVENAPRSSAFDRLDCLSCRFGSRLGGSSASQPEFHPSRHTHALPFVAVTSCVTFSVPVDVRQHLVGHRVLLIRAVSERDGDGILATLSVVAGRPRRSRCRLVQRLVRRYRRLCHLHTCESVSANEEQAQRHYA